MLTIVVVHVVSGSNFCKKGRKFIIISMPNPQLKATASLTQSFDVVIGFSFSE
jgi:hypothetical protein